MKSPAFQFYPDDFVGSGKVGTMTVDEVGAYTLLLCLEWNEIGFQFDEEECARWCRMSRAKFAKAWHRVSRCFVERDGRMFNPRLDKEREKQQRWREKSAEGGKASAQARAKGGSTVVQPPNQPTGNTPFPSPTPVTAKEPKGAARGKRPAGEPAPWMGLMQRAWTLGDIPSGSATLLQPIVGRLGAEETADRLRNYCEQAEPRFATVRDFAAKHEVYSTKGRPAVDPVTGMLNDVGVRALAGKR